MQHPVRKLKVQFSAALLPVCSFLRAQTLDLLRRSDLHEDFIYLLDFLCMFSQSELLILGKSEVKHCQRQARGWEEGKAIGFGPNL